MKKYAVRDTQYHNGIGDNDFPVYQVDFRKSEMIVQCSCNRYESYGLLCRHAFYVLRMNNVKEFPRIYLKQRWLKNAKPSRSALPRIIGASDLVRNEFLDLYEIFESTVDRLVHDLSKRNIYKDKLKELLDQAVIDIPTVPKLNGKSVMISMLGVKEPDEKTLNNPGLHKAK
ncbi:FAR1 DNA binding domain, Zinc finger, SWIM-type, MULE transposase domain, FHY3/FAR1 family [Artemisia annua]|uniref:FAR1 DNA binding domain, Zinc finger, SWIM-type, MULE transposase domain, FHY3/FAR1 family n=1 Tax=Artemisia annua TaxID=35608 RepID=A0A2U1MVS4_ARTAN|nr:FAR1 DNA binding domain, Zinc finger, SWIM-type, MULE transposase domain, FHY3/FAR1 family [Artemisia annua]